MDTVQVIISGLLLGGVYALFASGLNMIFGVMRVINLAQGELMMLGAYITFFLFDRAGLNPLLSIPLSAVALLVLGVALQFTLVERVVNQPLLSSLLLTFGLSTLMMGIALNLWTSNFRSVAWEPLTGSWDIGGLAISKSRFVAFLIALLVTGAMVLFLRRSRFGKAIRATSQHAEVAQICGVDVRQVRLVTFGLGSAMAGIAGTLIAMIFTINPEMGRMFIGKAFAIIVLGGLGSFTGAFVGALFLGVSETLAAYWTDTQLAEAVAYAVLLLVLLIRPSGLFGQAEG
jgi:branched-chain amino acid transport system permease protein